MAGLKVLHPFHGLLVLQCCLSQVVGDPVVALDLIDRQFRIGAVPEPADRAGGERPVLELSAVTRPVKDEKARRREPDAAAPGQRQTSVRLLDEIVEIAAPAMVEIAEEQQTASVVQESPMREMHGAHAAEIAIAR